MKPCYGCGAPTPAGDDVPDEAIAWCASCAVADVPVLMWELEQPETDES